MAIPPLVLRIYADSSGVKRGVAQAQTQVNGLRASIARNSSLIKTGLVIGVVAGLAKSVQAAADLGEAQNKANVVFGKSIGLVNKFAATASTGVGLAKAEVLSAAGAFGSMFDSARIAERQSAQMSVTMSQLAGDMASFNNEDPTDMLERLRSGLAGEAEPLRRFGVFISEARVETEAMRMGMEKVNGSFTDAQKIQARYNIILKDTKKQQGDFARTAGTSLPNQLRILRAQFIDLAAKLGKLLIPALIFLTKLLNTVVTWIADKMVPWLIKWGTIIKDKVVAAWNAAKGPILAVIHVITAAIEGLIKTVQTLIDWLKQAAEWAKGVFAGHHMSEAEARATFGDEIVDRIIAGTRAPSMAAAVPTRIGVTVDRRHYEEQSDYEASYRGF
jgi:hypothetical protein